MSGATGRDGDEARQRIRTSLQGEGARRRDTAVPADDAGGTACAAQACGDVVGVMVGIEFCTLGAPGHDAMQGEGLGGQADGVDAVRGRDVPCTLQRLPHPAQRGRHGREWFARVGESWVVVCRRQCNGEREVN